MRLKSAFENSAAYLLGAACFAAVLWRVLGAGAVFSQAAAPAAAGAAGFTPSPLGLLLLQIVVILAATRLCAAVLRRFEQPSVIGEVIGGILLGPSALGLLSPTASAFLFPPRSLGPLGLVSELGLVVFMFVVGMELDPELLERDSVPALLISHASIAAPFLLGSVLALFLYGAYAPAGVSFAVFALFLGVSMSITAFPVLARILREKRLTRAPLGALALASAAVGDFTAWCVLAFVAAIARGGAAGVSLRPAVICAAYILGMLYGVKPAFERWLRRQPADESLGGKMLLAALLAMFASAFLTESLGIHALFGAFFAGVVMPRRAAFRQGLARRLEDFSATALLPLFFALSGLRTQLGSLSSARDWAVCGVIFALAVAGKAGAGALGGRWAGKSWRHSLALGAMLNTRGLVELVALNIGYDLGLVTPALFTMLVLMALATTLMTGPLLAWTLPEELRRARLEAGAAEPASKPAA